MYLNKKTFLQLSRALDLLQISINFNYRKQILGVAMCLVKVIVSFKFSFYFIKFNYSTSAILKI